MTEGLIERSVVPSTRRLGEFVGRAVETEHLRRLVASGTPLMTVTGLSGVGKSRLVAEAIGSLTDGWFSASTPEDISSLAPAVRQRAAELFASPAIKRPLFVLDSIDDPSLGQSLVEAIDLFETIQVIVTSQTRLNVRGETVLRLEPLRYPTTATLSLTDALQYDAITCFVNAAQRIHEGFVLDESNAAAVCELVQIAGGLPLAIDLLANWLRVVGVGQLVEQARQSLEPLSGGPHDLPIRQRDLRTAITASIGLLSESDREVAGAIAHLGSCSLEGLHRGIGRPVELGCIGRLVDCNLVTVSDDERPTLGMHPTVRRVLAGGAEGATIERRFLDWVGHTVEQNAALLSTKSSKLAFRTLDEVSADITAALNLIDRHPLTVAKLVADLSTMWWLTAQHHVEEYWTRRALQLIAADDALCARLHLGAARALRFLLGHDEANRIWRRRGPLRRKQVTTSCSLK